MYYKLKSGNVCGTHYDIDFDVVKSTKKTNLRTGELEPRHHSYSTFYTSIWEYDEKPFFTFPHRCETKHFYKAERANMKEKKIFNKLT